MTNNKQESTKRYFIERSPYIIRDGASWGIKFLSKEITEVEASKIEEAFTLRDGNYLITDKITKAVSLVSGRTNRIIEEFGLGTTIRDVQEETEGLEVYEADEEELEVYIEDYIDDTDKLVRHWDGSNFRALWLRTEDMHEYLLDKDMETLDSREQTDHCLELRVGTKEGVKKYFFAYISDYQKGFFTSLWEISEEDAKKVFGTEGN